MVEERKEKHLGSGKLTHHFRMKNYVYDLIIYISSNVQTRRTMSLFPRLYSSLINFQLKGGHRRRKIVNRRNSFFLLIISHTLVEKYGTYTACFRAVSHCKRPYTAKLRLKIRLSVIIDPGRQYWCPFHLLDR